MKLKLNHFLLLVLIIAIVFSSCKKDNKSENDTNSQIEAQADDESQVSAELDAATLDVATIIEFNPATSGDNSTLDNLICDATIEFNAISNPMTATITYNGGDCFGNRTRTGKIVVSVVQGAKWNEAGTAVNVEFQNFKITRKKDNKSVTINGTKTYTNISGGLLIHLAGGENIIHQISSNGISVKFNDETAREWKIARQYSFHYDAGIVVAITGFHAENNVDGIVAWGTNRFGKEFTTVINEALIVKQSCSAKISTGILTHTTPAFSVSATFGLDAQGAPTQCAGSGNLYYKLQATGPNGGVYTKLIAY